MGVPGLWPFLNERYKSAVTRFPRGKRTFKMDNVYLDANGLLHGAAQEVYGYGQVQKRKLDPYANKTDEEKQLAVFKLFFDKIIEVTSMIPPQQLLYIAIDGPAPRAKQAQQRERRFVAAKLRPPSTNFDSNSITPGTEFMHNLSSFMFFRIREFMQSHSEWRTIRVIFSPPTVGGEGEHKIMDYIRSLPQSVRDSQSHCMFGPDGDLLILSLSVHIKRMFLFREDQYNIHWMDLTNMGIIRSGLSTAMQENDALKKRVRNYDDVSNDFALIGFLVGNDFLPKVKMFYKLDQGLEKMIDIYGELVRANKFLTKGRIILHSTFTDFIHLISEYEQDFIKSQATIIPPEDPRTKKPDPRFIDHTLLKFSTIEDHPEDPKKPKIVTLDFEQYRKEYYRKGDVDDEKGIREMCKKYIRSFIWVYIYYTSGLPSWNTAYEYHYPPLMCDLYATLKKMTNQEFLAMGVFEMGEPSLPFVQLLSVLPPASKKLLPQHYREIFTQGDLFDNGYYPADFDIDYEGKYKEHQGVTILPFVDRCLVQKVYSKYAKSDEFEYHRNSIGGVYEFRWTTFTDGKPQYTSTFKSKYGTINACHVVSKKI